MKNLMQLTLTLCLAVFISTTVSAQEKLTVKPTNSPGFYEILSIGNLDDSSLEQFCYKLNSEANMANYFESNTLLKFSNGVELLFFKTYRELNDFQAKLKRDASKTLSPTNTIKQESFPKALQNLLTTTLSK